MNRLSVILSLFPRPLLVKDYTFLFMKTSSNQGSDDEGADELAPFMPRPGADGFIFPECILNHSNPKTAATKVSSWPSSTCIDLTDDDPAPMEGAAVVPVVDLSGDEQEHTTRREESAFISSPSSSRHTTPTSNTIDKNDQESDELMDKDIDITGIATSDDNQDILTEKEYQLDDTATSVSPPPPPTTTRIDEATAMEEDDFDDFDISAELSDVNSSVFESPAPKTHGSSINIPQQPTFTTTVNTINGNNSMKTTTQRIRLGKKLERSRLKKRRCNKLPTGYVYDICMFFHAELEPLDGDAPHPESPYRIYEIYKRLKREGLLDHCLRIESRYATRHEILKVHGYDHYDKMRSLEGKSP